MIFEDSKDSNRNLKNSGMIRFDKIRMIPVKFQKFDTNLQNILIKCERFQRFGI